MRKVTGINLDPDVVAAVDKMAAKMGWSRSKTVNYLLRQGVNDSSNVLAGLADLTVSDVLELLAGRGVKKKLK
jgi:metal-responsive CopG/Arc/MetJ family transcriptional regulator